MPNRPSDWPLRRPKSKGVSGGGQADRIHTDNYHGDDLLYFEQLDHQPVHRLERSQGSLGLNYNISSTNRISRPLLDFCSRNSTWLGHPSITSQIHSRNLLADKFTAVLFSGLCGGSGTQRPLDRPNLFIVPYSTMYNF